MEKKDKDMAMIEKFIEFVNDENQLIANNPNAIALLHDEAVIDLYDSTKAEWSSLSKLEFINLFKNLDLKYKRSWNVKELFGQNGKYTMIWQLTGNYNLSGSEIQFYPEGFAVDLVSVIEIKENKT